MVSACRWKVRQQRLSIESSLFVVLPLLLNLLPMCFASITPRPNSTNEPSNKHLKHSPHAPQAFFLIQVSAFGAWVSYCPAAAPHLRCDHTGSTGSNSERGTCSDGPSGTSESVCASVLERPGHASPNLCPAADLGLETGQACGHIVICTMHYAVNGTNSRTREESMYSFAVIESPLIRKLYSAAKVSIIDNESSH